MGVWNDGVSAGGGAGVSDGALRFDNGLKLKVDQNGFAAGYLVMTNDAEDGSQKGVAAPGQFVISTFTDDDGQGDWQTELYWFTDHIKSTQQFRIDNGNLVIEDSLPPANASDNGIAGEIAWDANFIYVCVGTNQWKRVGISTW